MNVREINFAEKTFSEIETAISLLTTTWENVLIDFNDNFQSNFRNEKWKNREEPTPSELMKSYVQADMGIVQITIPENLDWVSTVLACCTENGFIDLNKQLEIFKHNLSNPDRNEAFKIYHLYKKKIR